MRSNTIQCSKENWANLIDLVSEQDENTEIQNDPTEMDDHYPHAGNKPASTQNYYAQLSDESENSNEEEAENYSLTLADFIKEKSDQSSLRVKRKTKRRKINEKKKQNKANKRKHSQQNDQPENLKTQQQEKVKTIEPQHNENQSSTSSSTEHEQTESNMSDNENSELIIH